MLRGTQTDQVNIYDTPLQVQAVLLAVGFVLTLLVRPLRASAHPAHAHARAYVVSGFWLKATG